MFQLLMRRAQTIIESSIVKAVNKAIMAVPFVVAAGFGTAALSLRLTREFGAETGHLLMAALFCIVGLLIAGVIATRSHPPTGGDEKKEIDASNIDEPPHAQLALRSNDSEQDETGLMTSLAVTLAPTVLPQLLRLVKRNLPLVALISASIYMLSRQTDGEHTVRPQTTREPVI